MLTAEHIRELLTYDPDTGIFRWRVARNNRIKAGSIAGSFKRATGYVEIHIDNKCYLAHRLAWFYMAGEWPADDIDHRNLAKDDNRWSNLRPATQSQNNANRRVMGNSKTGIKGVTKTRDRYRAQITVNGKRKYLGTVDNPVLASYLYRLAAVIYHREFARFV